MRLSAVRSTNARAFYESEALRGGWTIRQLDRQIQFQFYERTALSRDKVALLGEGDQSPAGDSLTPDEEIKDPMYDASEATCARWVESPRLSRFLISER